LNKDRAETMTFHATEKLQQSFMKITVGIDVLHKQLASARVTHLLAGEKHLQRRKRTLIR